MVVASSRRSVLLALALALALVAPAAAATGDDSPVLNPESCSPFSKYPASLVERVQHQGYREVEPLPAIYFIIRRAEHCGYDPTTVAFEYSFYMAPDANYAAMQKIDGFVAFEGRFGMMGISWFLIDGASLPGGASRVLEGQGLPSGLYRFVRLQAVQKSNGFTSHMVVIAPVQ